jgi:hypothetical protein
MTTSLGVSSGSAPQLSARKLAQMVRSYGADTVDLRSGAGHRWEVDGVGAFAAAGLRIAFIGVDLATRHAADQAGSGSWERWVDSGSPLKIKAPSDCLADGRVQAEIRCLADRLEDPGLLLVETHAGGASVDDILELVWRYGIRVCLDLLGLALIHPRPREAMDRLNSAVGAVQVKGFDWDSPRPGAHLPLAALPGSVLDHLLEMVVGTDRPVTVESRAGVLGDDVALLREAVARLSAGRSRCDCR